jgi:hypothetical protein
MLAELKTTAECTRKLLEVAHDQLDRTLAEVAGLREGMRGLQDRAQAAERNNALRACKLDSVQVRI